MRCKRPQNAELQTTENETGYDAECLSRASLPTPYEVEG
jgi:hypothetical protein